MDFLERAAKYREFARQARLEAERMTSAAGRDGLLKIAQEWDHLADETVREYNAES